ncbi:MAG: GNAT family N-acetyltransferase [Candidatus Bathyarchaeia archaeon]|jgi:GNAT superfamily N-acetyltransferase
METDTSSRQQVKIVNMTAEEVQTAIQWAQAEGWNPGLHDGECFYNTDPKGFYAAKINGKTVGTVSIVKYSDDFAFAGFYVVMPDFRGKGIGLTLQEFVLSKCQNLNLGIDGVVNMQSRYEQSGFKTAYNNTRYSGVIKSYLSDRCVSIKRADFNKVVEFDANFFPANRSNFLDCWLYQNDITALMIQDGDKIRGYGVIRKCFQGYKIGPLFAEDKVTAELLLSSLASRVSGEEVFLDVPEPNIAGVALAKSFGMKPVFSTVRMYTKDAPKLPLEKIFGVTTFELG